MDWTGYDAVERIEGKVSGVPLLKGTRMPPEQVIEILDSGKTVEEIAYNHDLDPAGILHLKRFREIHLAVLRP